MKTKNASGLVVGIIITLFMVIIVGIIIMWGSGYFSQNKKSLDKSTGKIDKKLGEMSDFDLTVYDDGSISGDALTELIEDVIDKEEVMSIHVKTLAHTEGISYNYAYDDAKVTITSITNPPLPTPSKTDIDYINPNASFKGEVIRNANDEIICIKFTQQK